MKHSCSIENARRHASGEDGSVVVLTALMLTVLLAFCGAALDVGLAYIEAGRVQTALDAGSRAGAASLPDTSAASSTALGYVALNGVDPSGVTVEFSGGDSVITLSCRTEVPTAFLRVLGIDEFDVARSSSAELTADAGVFGYRIFSGCASHTFSMGGKFTIDGSVHSNGGLTISPSSGVITGSAEGCSSVYVNPWTATVGSQIYPAEYIEMPDFSAEIAARMPETYDEYANASVYNSPWWRQTWTGSKHITGNVSLSNGADIYGDVYIDGNFTANGGAPVCVIYGDIYVDGDIAFNNTVEVYGSVFATGDIDFRGGGCKVDPDSPICIYSANGDIDLTMASASVSGIVYAPNGSLKLAGGTLDFRGSLVAYKISGIPADLVMAEPDIDLGLLPLSYTVRLVG